MSGYSSLNVTRNMYCNAEGGADIVPIYAQEMGFTEQTWQQRCWQQLEATWHMYIHVDQKSKPKQALACATSPLVLFMHLTNPSLHIGTLCLVLHMCASCVQRRTRKVSYGRVVLFGVSATLEQHLSSELLHDIKSAQLCSSPKTRCSRADSGAQSCTE